MGRLHLRSRRGAATVATSLFVLAGLLTAPTAATADSADDVLMGTPGPDTLHGGTGIDQLTGRGGDDRLLLGRGGTPALHEMGFGQRGDDLLFGGSGADLLWGGPGLDELHGGPGGDELADGPGNDLVLGGRGVDYVGVGSGADVIRLGPGDDRVDLRRDGKVDRIACGRGDDSLNWIGRRDPKDQVAPDCEEVVLQARPPRGGRQVDAPATPPRRLEVLGHGQFSTGRRNGR